MLGIGLALPSRLRVPTVAAPIDYPARWGLLDTFEFDSSAGALSLVGAKAGTTLTNNNTATLAAGQKVGTGALQLTGASSQSLSLADNATFSMGDVDFWVACWFWYDSLLSTFPVIVGKNAATSAATEFDLHVSQASSAPRFQIGGAAFKQATWGSALSSGQWYFVMGYHDSVNDLVAISIDGGAFVTVTTSAQAVPDSTSALRIGARNGTPDRFWNGRIDSLSIGKSPPLGIAALANEIRDTLYNGGVGRPYPFS